MDEFLTIKLIVCDMDGTLLHDDHSLDDEIVNVIKQLRAQGIQFTLASGRNVHIMSEFIQQLSIDVPYITNNGANMFLKDNCMFEQVIIHEDLRYILTLLESMQLPYLAYTNTKLFGSHVDASLQKFLRRLQGKVEIYLDVTKEDILKQDIFKIILMQEDDILINLFMERVKQGCRQAHCVQSEGSVYAISNSSVSKGNALLQLLAQLKISQDQVLVFGDNYNDISMFDMVSNSVAMGNSSDEIKKKASYITKTNNENGVSNFIKKYIL